MNRILIRDVINSTLADDDVKGELVFRQIKQQSSKNRNLVLDFDGIELVNTAFLNDAIGRLFDSNSFDLSEYPVKIANMNQSMRDLLLETIKVARSTYQ